MDHRTRSRRAIVGLFLPKSISKPFISFLLIPYFPRSAVLAHLGTGLFEADEESPVAAPNSYPANAPFGIVVVDFQIAVLAKAVERYPVLEHIPHSLARRALWQQLCLNLQ